MKRLLLVLFAGLLLNIHVFAQFDTNDYEYYDDAEYAEEPVTNAPTNITVNNTGAEDQTEQKLTLPNSQPIYLYFYNSVQNPNPPEQAPPEPKAEQKPPAEPEPIIEYRYLPAPTPAPPPPPPPPEPTPPPPPPPPPQVEYRYIQPPPVEYIYLPSPQVEYIYVQPPAPEPVYIQPPLQIRVIPGLPDPNSPKIYRIQVGSYAVHNTADIMAQRIRSTGLQVDTEYYNSLKRVSVPGVRAADVCTILQMLESLGFAEVWIRE